jgi:hypothetical protein
MYKKVRKAVLANCLRWLRAPCYFALENLYMLAMPALDASFRWGTG